MTTPTGVLQRIKISAVDKAKRWGPYDEWYALLGRLDDCQEEYPAFISARLRTMGRLAAGSEFYRMKHGQSRLRQLDRARLSDLEPLSKAELRAHGDDIRRLSWRPYRRTSTGGTSGTPLTLYQTLAGLQAEQAFFDRMWGRLRFTPASRLLVIRGGLAHSRPVVTANRMVLSTAGIDNDPELTIRQIRAFNPGYLHCYPSTAIKFAAALLAAGVADKINVQGVFCGSEAIYDHQVTFLENVFGCEVIAWYGHAEQGGLAIRNGSDGSYLFHPAYGHVDVVKNANGFYELVTTGWLNEAMPLIRYRTSDFVEDYEWVREPDSIPALRVSRILGREQELFIALDGALQPFNHIVFGLHGDAWNGIEDFLFVQPHAGHLDLQVRVNTRMRVDECVSRLQSRLAPRMRGMATLRVLPVSDVERTTAKRTYFRSLI